MGLGTKLRNKFKKKGDGSSSGGSTPSTSSDPTHYTGRTDIEYYKPHEIPKSKYKGRVDPEHKEKLDSYSFADAFNTVRRKSSQALSGIMSPGGTKAQSRRPSYVSHASFISNSRRKSVASAIGPDANPLSRTTTSAGAPATLIRENSDDDTDVHNAGFSTTRSTAASQPNVPDIKLQRQATVPDQPFTAEQLEYAMTQATLRPNSPPRSSLAIAAH